MDKKQIIQISVIVIAFGAAGLVLYNGLFKNNSSGPELVGNMASSTGASIAAGQAIQNAKQILPNGDTLDFSVLRNPNGPQLHFNQIIYPQLNPALDVGVNENNLISNGNSTGQ